jgi:hypothetical protein
MCTSKSLFPIWAYTTCAILERTLQVFPKCFVTVAALAVIILLIERIKPDWNYCNVRLSSVWLFLVVAVGVGSLEARILMVSAT